MELKAWLYRVLAMVAACFLVVFWMNQITQPQKRQVRQKVRFWHMWTAEWKDFVDRVVERFNAEQDEFEVEALSIPTAGADSKFILGVLGGDPPDVMAQWNPVIPPWADSHLIQPLEDLMTPKERKTFEDQAYPVVKKLGTYKGKLYGMSIGVNMFALYYRPEHLEEAGIDSSKAPRTLEQLDEWGRKLDKRDSRGNLVRLGWLPSGFPFFASLFNGGLYDWTYERLTIDTPQNLKALKYIADSRKRLGYEQIVRFNSGLNTASFSGGWPFIGGAYSFTLDGQWRVEQLRKHAPNLVYATAPVPPPRGGRPLAGTANGNFMIVPTGARNSKGAWAFISFWAGLTNPERAAEFYTWGGQLPLTPAIACSRVYQEYLAKNPQFKTFVDLMPSKNIEVMPPIAYQTFLTDHIAAMEDSVTRGTLSPEAGLAQLSVTVEREAKRRRRLGY